MNLIRCAKGAVAASAATAACYAVMRHGYDRAREAATAADARGDTFGGAVEHGLTTAASWTLMPVLLWVGMRLLREDGNTVFVVAGGGAWVFGIGMLVDYIDHHPGSPPYIAFAVYVIFCAVLPRDDNSPRS
ncbi:hypothetical protein AB0G74_13670 [Streptomyces sp. NPDC020875]|uniref:hypothetical protein n=1 Tax=Streptomyces sp. NPDC020875 TaxID=3154898 RepID=UPI0033CDC1BE